GVVGVATGGVGMALGALSMTTIGALLGGVGGAAGGVLVRVPIISPFFWVPVLFVGLYLLVGALRKSNPEAPTNTQIKD
ncbi:MAG: hypothetical protein O9331_03285, partial [Acidovorax sp.]|nr:hypothetical protein [Acidovorax sp.]